MKKQHRFKLLITSVLLLFVLAACSNNGGIYSDEGQVFRKVITQDMSSLDTAKVTDSVSFDKFNQVYEGLYTLDKNDSAVPGVAKGQPKISDDGKTWTIELRKNAKWSNGDPVTAHDFVFAWRRVLDPNTASEYAYIMYDLKNAEQINMGKKKTSELGVKALDDYTLQFELEKPIPYYKEMLAFGTFLPQNEKVVKKFGDRYGTTAEKAVYNGPFKVKKWAVEDKILLVKNDKYWDKDVVKLDKINYKVLKDGQAGASLYDTGSVDDTVISSEQVDKYKGTPALQKRLLAATFYLKLNQDAVPALKNKDMRLALAKAVDKQAYVDAVLNNGSTPTDGFTSKETAKDPDGNDYTDQIKSPLKYNPDEAKASYEKAKKALGQNEFTFKMNTDDTPANKISAEFIKAQIEKNLPGVTVKIQQLPFKQRIAREQSGKYEISISGWGPDYPDAMTYLNIMTTGNSSNNTGWSNKEYDQKVKDANGPLLSDVKKRNQTLVDAEELLLAEAPIAPIYQKGEAHLTNPQVKNLQYHNIGGDTSLKYAYIDKSIDRETGKKKEK
ncbi:peptide ABC transporter substrate-binding protein [Staphylococcus intermedius]|uniref:Oligopeptide ABC transporter periplasmic oligopeptide-binding protein n=1 Tax=Staphylococcus intermedius NCTC 11048 TaxID=1141106 RepID=A0A380GAM1_STAIN|nr:peptide ABC transporter substrate-binding protein [Staphylococcus intermedius]PCF65326.1 peptide ABC transporter substrate-binding protein [Staphylococcus intermedius]PCF81004.1 peptide ABC transporter substrate-binding protein [Staphylococcus intermedius]PCF82286.1 peptide ABC transporter substrate-binding protein [Staphylococcus intermedius]PCF86986.1 peptide ABC transporter substrate-binding protein [Staphylococcus intermedius]PCF87547.1 peptide ABC transporter substrate-binding protein 